MIEEACNPTRTERFSNEDLVRVKKYIEISPSYVYTRKISAKKPFTEDVRTAMTENAKQSAYKILLGQNDKNYGGTNGEFSNDHKVFNFAKSEVFKNASVRKPARLNEIFGHYTRSIGQIMCGEFEVGTCFLVTHELVITNYHVYRDIKWIRFRENANLPIFVRFDYLHAGQRHNFLTVEVDERNSTLENPYLDYKFFRLKQSEGLRGRVPLGPMVRNWQLSDGRVIILGHPKDNEMQEEVCVVVGYRAMHETLRKRHEQFSGVHMTNVELLHKTEKYQRQGCLPYDTTCFRGSSGSPVFEMNGYIVAMHTQGYLLKKEVENTSIHEQENVPNHEQENVPNHEQGNVPNHEQESMPNLEQENVPNLEQENIPNLEQENVPNYEQEIIPNHEQVTTRTYSLMEFGVQFISICTDIRIWHGDDVVQRIFPNYLLEPGEEPMDLN